MNQTYTDFIKNKPVETVFRIHAILLSIFAIQKLLSKKSRQTHFANNKKNKLSYVHNWKSAPAIMQPHICR